MNPVIEIYLNNLLKELDLGDLDDNAQKQLKADLNGELEDRINSRILTELGLDNLESFDKVLDENDPIKTQAYLKENISDYDQVIQSELVAFRSLYVA